MLIRYEVRIGDDIHGIFRVPQNTDLLNDDEYDLYYEFYNELPCKKLEDPDVGIMVEGENLTIVVTKHNSFPKDDNFIQFIKDWMNSHGLKNKLVYGYDVYLN